MKNYQEAQVLQSLKGKHDISLRVPQTVQILIDKTNEKGGKDIITKGDVGIKSKGMIDFLRKYCGYSVMHTTKFTA